MKWEGLPRGGVGDAPGTSLLWVPARDRINEAPTSGGDPLSPDCLRQGLNGVSRAGWCGCAGVGWGLATLLSHPRNSQPFYLHQWGWKDPLHASVGKAQSGPSWAESKASSQRGRFCGFPDVGLSYLILLILLWPVRNEGWRDNSQIPATISTWILELCVACPLCHLKETPLCPHPLTQAQTPNHHCWSGCLRWEVRVGWEWRVGRDSVTLERETPLGLNS